jgi:predicted TIM-barrel fold metal-dependent hydrolase
MNGEYDRLFATAEKHHVPVFILLSGYVDLLRPYALRFPNLQFIIDHIGVEWPEPDAPASVRYARLDPVLAMSDFPNVALKWAHVERLAADSYPFRDAMPHLRRLVDAFGADRVMWASDATQTKDPARPHQATWAQLLHHLLDSELFSDDEKEWMLGRTVRSLLRWNRQAHGRNGEP